MTDQNLFSGASSTPDWDAIAAYVAGEGTPEERAAMRRVLDANPEHAALLLALDDAVRLPEPAASTSAEVEAALSAVRARRELGVIRGDAPRRPSVMPISRGRPRWRGMPLRAAAAILVVAGVGLIWRASNSSQTPGRIVQKQYASAVGALDSLTLPDGTRVLLGPGSELTIGDQFGVDTRDVQLKGEARFDVVHDASHPFVVHTAMAAFRDIGTVFSVHSDAADGSRVVVTEGAVAVESKGVRAATLKAGDRATVASDGGVRVEQSSATNDDMAWTAGRLVFNDASVAQVAADLRRWYGIELTIDSVLASKTVNATFDRGGADGVGKVLAAVLGGSLEQSGSSMRIVAPGARK
ncbi:MAG: FecR protein [Gemmatimonadetes bacterium]|nr:FecR protein [Gemmatimonadota bacterium]